MSCEFCPEIRAYTAPGSGTLAANWLLVPEIAAADPPLAAAQDDACLIKFFQSVLLRLTLDIRSFAYFTSWDAEPAHFDLPTGRQTLYRAAAEPPRAGEKLPRALLVSFFPEFPGLGSETFSFLHLPPHTKVTPTTTADNVSLTFRNAFAHVTMTLRPHGVQPNVGILRDLCRLDPEEEKRYRTVSFLVTLEAYFPAFRIGHPKMSSYRRWVSVAVSELQAIGSERRWQRTKDTYLLRYATRTESPMAEMQRKLLERLQSTPSALRPEP